MVLQKLNKYLLNLIFSYLNFPNQLKIIKYNKKYQSKLNLNLYSYKKYYFNSIITPGILSIPEILVQNNIFDEKTLKQLKADWENETKEIINERDCFHFNDKNKTKIKDIGKIKILNISLNDLNLLKNSMPNLIELNLSKIKRLELPCSILQNLETLSLKDISKIKFISNKDTISLNKLKHLYLDYVSLDDKNKLKINIDNIKYLDLRLKEQDSFEEDSGFNNDNNTSGFYKEKTIEYLMNIFDFKFLELFPLEQKKYIFDEIDDEIIEDTSSKYNDFQEIFKKPKEIFQDELLKKLNYFNFEILYEYFEMSGSATFANRFIYKYLFSKMKNNKYLFKTKKSYYEDCDGDYFEGFSKEDRYCDKIDYNNYYFINKSIEVCGSFESILKGQLNCKDINSFNLVSRFNEDSNGQLNLLMDIKKTNNCLENISLDILNLENKSGLSLINNVKNFNRLKTFYIKDDFRFKNNKEFIKLLKNLAILKSLLVFEITIKRELKLNKGDNKIIYNLFPDISIKIIKKSTIIKWNNRNAEFKIIKLINN